MPFDANIVPYDIVFTLMLVMIAVLCGPKLACVARLLILLYVPFAFLLSLYYLCLRPATWDTSVDGDGTPDTTRYSRAARRSSAIYIAMNILLFIGAKILKVSFDSVIYNYIALFVTSMISYWYDRAVSTDDGLRNLKVRPGTTIWDAYLSFCSPAFMRYVIVLSAEISLMILIAYYIGSLIPKNCGIISTIFRKSVVPVVVFSIVGGPLRFAWAYPTVSEGSRVPYLTAYMIAFTILAVITYASGTVSPKSVAGVLILMSLIAIILQTGGLSNAQRESDVVKDASVMPSWLMFIFATLIIISLLAIVYKVFIKFLHPYLIVTASPTHHEDKSQKCSGPYWLYTELRNAKISNTVYVEP